MSFDRAAYMKAYQAANKQLLREYNAFYYREHKEELKADRDARRDELNAYRHNHYHRNKQNIIAQQREYRVKKKSTVRSGNSEAAQDQITQLHDRPKEAKNQCPCAF